MRIFAIDPGTDESAYVYYDPDAIPEINNRPKFISKGILDNEELLIEIACIGRDDIILIEMCQSFGMAVGRSIFETVFWIGRFYEASKCNTYRIYRMDIKLHHCNSTKAKDGNIIQALKDKYGDKGIKARPGFFYGFRDDIWQAFALCAYAVEVGIEKMKIV